jgi:hypothetical protein
LVLDRLLSAVSAVFLCVLCGKDLLTNFKS